MTQKTQETQETEATGVAVTVRYFAAARAAAGTELETVRVSAGSSVAALAEALADRNERLATVLSRCSYLRDGVAVRDHTAALLGGETIDILPPFAGG